MEIYSKLLTFILLVLLATVSSDDKVVNEITCESIAGGSWNDGLVNLKTCRMRSSTSINSFGIIIESSKDESVKGLSFYTNKNISFLPVNVAEVFPDLEGYSADDCSIKIVSKIYFQNLSKLTTLGLSNNLIERIPTNTFEDLTSVEIITLRKNVIHLLQESFQVLFFPEGNNINFLNSAAFDGLEKLQNVYLRENSCIKHNYLGSTLLETMKGTLDQHCSYSSHHETSYDNHDMLQIEQMETTSAKKILKEQQKSLLNLQEGFLDMSKKDVKIEMLESNLKEINSELGHANIKIVKLQTELNASNEMNLVIKEFLNKFDLQRNETFAAKSKELRDNFEIKMRENEELRREAQEKDQKLKEMRAKIKKLEEKIEILSVDQW